MTKAEALRAFRETVLPFVRADFEKGGCVDTPARCEAWNDYTDGLRADGQITERQYSSWGNPF